MTASDRERLERYFDGALPETERVELEARLATDSGLADEVARQRAIDERLRRAFVVPHDAGRLALAALADEREPTAGPWRVPGWLLAAAALVMTLGTAAWWTRDLGAPSGYGVRQVYAELAAGSDLVGSCQAANEVTTSYLEDFGTRLTLRVPAGQSLVGPVRSILLPTATAFIGGSADEPIIVLVDGVTCGWQPLLPDDDLRRHERQVGDVRLVELSPHAEPRCLDWFDAAGER